MYMMAITGACSRFIGDLVQTFGRVSRSRDSRESHEDLECKPEESLRPVDDLMIRALTAVFGMENNGKIKKEKARQVVEKLGLIYSEEEKTKFDLPGGTGVDDEVAVEEVIGGIASDTKEGSKRNELLREAFKIFDEDGDGYIEASELKRVLQCLGLDKGWDMGEIEMMLKVVDLDLDGKIDFGEFELMTGQ